MHYTRRAHTTHTRALAYSLTGPSAALLARSFNLSGVATLGVGSSLVGALGGWINVTVIAADGGLPPLSVTASIRVFVALSYVRPVYPAPTVLRVSRPGHDRLEVAEVVALSPPGGAAGGANVAAGAPALSSDTHFGWFGAGEPLGPQPAYLVTNGVYRDYASVWLGAVAPEPAAAGGCPFFLFSPPLTCCWARPQRLLLSQFFFARTARLQRRRATVLLLALEWLRWAPFPMARWWS